VIIAPLLPNGTPRQGHLSLSDPPGLAIFEYVAGKLVIHHGRKYQVMTNSPNIRQQLALNAYWEQIGGTTMPGNQPRGGSIRPGSFYINAIPKTTIRKKGLPPSSA